MRWRIATTPACPRRAPWVGRKRCARALVSSASWSSSTSPALVAYLFLAPFALFIFWAVNGFLLGREYAQMVAMRRMSRADARAFRATRTGARSGRWAC